MDADIEQHTRGNMTLRIDYKDLKYLAKVETLIRQNSNNTKPEHDDEFFRATR